MNHRLHGKMAVVVGGGNGIGAASSTRLADEGAVVVVADIDLAAAEHVARAIENTGAAALAIGCDIADQGSAKDLFAQVSDAFGGVDLLHNVAADLSPPLSAGTPTCSTSISPCGTVRCTSISGATS